MGGGAGDEERGADAAMERYADGDASAFATVYDLLAPQLLRYLRRCAGDHAEDIMQQTFFQMHLARGTFVRGGRVRPWAFAIARRLMVDCLRRVKTETAAKLAVPRARLVGEPDAPPDEAALAHETARELAWAYDRVPAAHREALELLRDDGVSTREAASILGTTVAAVKLRSFRAVQALRRIISRGGDR